MEVLGVSLDPTVDLGRVDYNFKRLMIERAGAGAGMAQAQVWRGYGAGAGMARVWRRPGYGAGAGMVLWATRPIPRTRHLVFQHRRKIPNSFKNLTRDRV